MASDQVNTMNYDTKGAAESVEIVFEQQKKTADGEIVFIPQPSDDPSDPLNWPMRKKILMLGIVCGLAYTSQNVLVSNSAGLVVQGLVYGKTPLQMSYSLSAGIAGDCAGPLIATPIARRIGRSACIFWGLTFCLCCTIWSATMTKSTDYIPFVMSRLIGGLFGSVATTLGSSIIIDVFFLHQRGKAFTSYAICILLGTILGPMFSGFITDSTSWTIQYWYNVPIESATLLVCFFFLEETGFTRPGQLNYPTPPNGFIANRIATFVRVNQVVPKRSWADVMNFAASQFIIGASPVMILGGLVLLVNFGWAVGVNTVLGVALQTPVEVGGYGFTPSQNALFLFAGLAALVSSQIYGILLADRLPLYICKRFNGGIWKPEYRLHAMWGPSLLCLPIGLGLYGSALEYHLHYMVLAVGVFLVFFANIAGSGPIVTYLVECFTHHPAEATSALTFYRLILGLLIPFCIGDWEMAVGFGWTYGMMAFFSVMVFGFIILLMYRGHEIRQYTLGSLQHTEEGTKIERSISEKIENHDGEKVKQGA